MLIDDGNSLVELCISDMRGQQDAAAPDAFGVGMLIFSAAEHLFQRSPEPSPFRLSVTGLTRPHAEFVLGVLRRNDDVGCWYAELLQLGGGAVGVVTTVIESSDGVLAWSCS